MTTKWNAHLYDQKHDFVSKFGSSLIDLLAPVENESILDVGCGTGDLAHELTTLGASVIGVDASAEMIYAAQQKYPRILFQTMDATELPFAQQFDAVFSNAALHWMKEPELVIEKAYRALKDEGRFVAEMGGQGNIGSIVWALQNSMQVLQLPYFEHYFPWYFPSAEEYQAKLEYAGFHVEMMTLYERPTPLHGQDGLRHWLVMFSDNLLQHLTEDEKEQVYATCEELLKPICFHQQQWIIDYYRLRFIARKK